MQVGLLRADWPGRVLAVPACKPVTSPSGELLSRGPLVRMGINWATEDVVVHKIHTASRSHAFSGPGLIVCQEVSDAANGGQVIITQEAWRELSLDMPAAGFPVVQLLGLFQLDSVPGAPVWLYQICERLGEPTSRIFPLPRKIRRAWPAEDVVNPPEFGLDIVPPSFSGSSGGGSSGGAAEEATFVAMRLTSFPRKAATKSVPEAVQKALESAIAVQAQQFGGYKFEFKEVAAGRGEAAPGDSDRAAATLEPPNCNFYICFRHSMDALRFCHACQMLLMYTAWPPEARPFFGETVMAADGRWLFHGPRVAMAAHTTFDYQVRC